MLSTVPVQVRSRASEITEKFGIRAEDVSGPVVDGSVAEVMEGKIFNPSLFTGPLMCSSNMI